MVKLVNRAKMSTATTGTGTITLGSAVSGFQSFAAAGVVDANVVRYTIEDGSNWEVGSGTYTSAGTTLSRTPSESSNAGSAINLSGTATVFVTAAAADLQELVTFAETFALPTSDGTNGQVLTTNGSGALTFTTVGGASSPEIGQIVFAETAPTTGTWLEAGKYYSKASYSALATALGDVPDIGSPAAPQNNILPQYSVVSTTGFGYAVATDGTVSVAVGNSGTIMYTTDGLSWKATPSFTSNSTGIMNVQYLNSRFVATGTGSGPLLTYSTNGIDWTPNYTLPAGTYPSVAYGAGVYVLAGTGLRYSANLETWTLSNETSFAPRRVLYANGIFVAIGNGCRTSTDGITWTTRTVPSGTFEDLIYANGLFVAFTGGRIATSTDGITWTERTNPAGFGGRQVIYANNLFVAVGIAGATSSIITSSDGITWTDRTPAGYLMGYYSVCWTGTTFVAAGPYGRYATSADGITWTASADPSMSSFLYVASVNSRAIGFSQHQSVILAGYARTVVLEGSLTPGYFLSRSTTSNQPAVAHNGTDQYVMAYGFGSMLVSPDAETWTIVDSGDKNAYDKLFYLNGNYLALGPLGALLTSSNGTSWTPRSTPSYNWNAAAYGASVYVAAGSNGTSSGGIASSPDGVTWTQRVTESIPFYDMIYANGLFVAVGGTGNGSTGTGVAYRSADGITWTSISGAGLPTLVGWNRIIYQNSLFVLIGNAGRIATSVDGITWTARTSNVTGILYDVTRGGSLFCAVGVNVITTSPDGVTWTSRPVSSVGNLHAVYHDGSKFCAYANDNYAVLKSTDGVTWNRGSTGVLEVSSAAYPARFLAGKHIFAGSAAIQTSTDAESWTPNPCVAFTSSSTVAAYNLGGFYYALTNTGLYSSGDGISFSPVKSVGRRQHRAMAYSGSTWVLVAAPSTNQPQTFYRSTNGTTWTKVADFYANAAGALAPSGNGNDLVFCGTKFFCAQASTTTVPFISQGLLTSTDGITWTPQRASYPGVTVGALATDGTKLLATTNAGAVVSEDEGATWTLLDQATSGGVANYSNGVWTYNGNTTADFFSAYSTTTTFNVGFYVVSESLIYSFDSLGNIRRYTLGADAVPTLRRPSSSKAGVNTSSHKGFILRGAYLLVPGSVSADRTPYPLLEFPIYSYNTSTTFWVPFVTGTLAQKAYVYAGA